MSGYDEIGAMEFSKGFLLVQGKADSLRKMLIKEYGLDEATANWHIEQAQQWAAQARKELNWKDGECGGWYKPKEYDRKAGKNQGRESVYLRLPVKEQNRK